MSYPGLFRIFYTTFFTILNLALLGLLLITPADAITQALSNGQPYNVFVIAGCYVLTLALAFIIYVSRLYTNRTVLAGIPKTWIPVEKSDVDKSVRKMIVSSLSRNAVIAWNARPRAFGHEATTSPEAGAAEVARVMSLQTKEKPKKFQRFLRKSRTTSDKDERGLQMPPHPPVWGEIEHIGWSSPSSPDLPNLQYITVIHELPHLIEAKAVSLAPPDPTSSSSPPAPDLRAIDLLQRPSAMGLRDYLSHLTSLGLFSTLPDPDSLTTFLTAYETARFAPTPATDTQFRDLMRLFASILRAMTALDPYILASILGPSVTDDGPESSTDADASSTTTSEGPPSHSRSRIPSHSRSRSRTDSEGTIRTAPSRPRLTAPTHSLSHTTDNTTINNNNSNNRTTPALGFATAPATPRGKKRDRDRLLERSPSLHSFAQTRRPFVISRSSSSEEGMQQEEGGEGEEVSDGGSVVRLSLSGEGNGPRYANANEDGDPDGDGDEDRGGGGGGGGDGEMGETHRQAPYTLVVDGV